MAFLLAAPGCGYRMGSIANPQIKSVGVAALQNETYEPYLSDYMRQSLCERFQFDNSFKVKAPQTADCVVYGRIIKLSNAATDDASTNDAQMFRPAQFEVAITFEFVVIIPGKAEPLISPRKVVGTATYQVIADQNTTRKQGLEQACRDAATQVVQYVAEGW